MSAEAIIEAPPPSPAAPPVAPPVAPPAAALNACATAAPSPEFLRAISHAYARRHLVLSAGVTPHSAERLLIAARSDPYAVFNVGVAVGRALHTELVADESLAAAIDRIYREAAQHTEAAEAALAALDDGVARTTVQGSDDIEGDLADALRDARAVRDEDLLDVEGKAHTVRLVDLLIFEALLRGASDVHVQPLRGRTLVRYRLDGVLHTVRELPASLAGSVVTRVKVMARLDVAERRAPQDGRAAVTIGRSLDTAERRIDLRISTLPSTYGERVVIRLLDPRGSAHLLTFSALGMPAEIESRYTQAAARTNGIVLSTGPTGSGKTTTLYTTLAWITAANAGAQSRGCELNIMTIEDPVEYDLGSAQLSVSQTQVDPKKGLTFASGLRHVLRQDPDVIMVGEVRDEETARIAVQASLTGHLVLSTLHTNDAPGAVARLIDLGVEPFLVSCSLSAVLAQRLVRRLHAPCDGAGCAECLRTGYRGRTGIFELLTLDAELRDLVSQRTGAYEIKTMACRKGMRTLRQAGEELAAQRITTMAEVTRVIEVGND